MQRVGCHLLDICGCVGLHIYTYIYISIYTYIYIYRCIYVYIYIDREGPITGMKMLGIICAGPRT